MDGYSPPRSLLDQLLEQEEAEFWEERRKVKPDRAGKKQFRSSLAWRRCRYAVLKANREKYGQLTCEVCKSTKGPFHVDHIFPVSKFWDKRFDTSLMQCACADCNIGKLNTDTIDWREPKDEESR